ncbi:hypothetical protein PFLUV_G00105270 [Perca fluviatilis]|uniref:Uncharacterized protein n=2 Tax=Perca fluviatilis TaxID=8168 RepID=A0A6A5E8I0_PERFL|nr:uncharacterized protein si:ch211-1a19.3 isoform X2 [Perca fluviatilis]KAF1385201.1 hypothetical protein PFLUV_G00105270 [Perca fluviatilis]
MTTSSSSKARSVVLALLALWAVVSLVVIVVWATSPDLKGAAQCRAELQEAKEKLAGAKVVFAENKAALEDMVHAAREETARQTAEVVLVLARLNATNATLQQSLQENAVLKGNISVLQERVETLRQTEANLTAHISLQDDHIEALQQNVTQFGHQMESCLSLRTAAESQMLASQSQTRACQSQQQYLNKQLQKCKEDAVSEKAKETKQEQKDAPSTASPLAGLPALTLLVCSALHIIT